MDRPKADDAVGTPQRADEQLIAMLVDRARSEGLYLTGEGGLLQQLTKRVLESALKGEITDHLGYDKPYLRAGLPFELPGGPAFTRGGRRTHPI